MEYIKYLWLFFCGFSFIAVVLAIAAAMNSSIHNQDESKICYRCKSKVSFLSENGRLVVWCDNCNSETMTIVDG